MKPTEQLSAFFANVAQTSLEPMGLVVREAHGCAIRTADGKEYLDLLAGIGVAALGHGNAEVLAAINAQAQRHLHVMVYGEFVQDAQAALASRLAGLLPAQLSNVYFTNSGAEAVEGAIKLVRKATGRTRIMSFRGGFHGDTTGAVAVGGNPLYRDPFLPLLPDVDFLTFNDIESLRSIDERTAAVIVEPVQAEAGVVLPDSGFLAALRSRCDETGALLIFDEVITGLGRTGSLFAFEQEGAVPDVLLLAKALGGGLPLGAFIASKKLMRTLAEDPPLGHVTTFGGHPLSCAAGLACLEVILRDDLPARAESIGHAFADRLRQAFPSGRLKELRQRGLLLGLEMDTADFVPKFSKECRAEGLIMGWTLHDDRVVRLAPPLTITEAEIDEAAHRMSRAAVRVG